MPNFTMPNFTCRTLHAELYNAELYNAELLCDCGFFVGLDRSSNAASPRKPICGRIC